MKKKTRIWIGMGASVLTGIGAAQPAAADTAGLTLGVHAQSEIAAVEPLLLAQADGGEAGGEGGEAGAHDEHVEGGEGGEAGGEGGEAGAHEEHVEGGEGGEAGAGGEGGEAGAGGEGGEAGAGGEGGEAGGEGGEAGAHEEHVEGGEGGEGGEAGAGGEGGEAGAGGEGGEAGAGGEGGEGGEGGAAAGPERAFLTNIALIRGHLAVARELAEAGEWEQAEAHALHPSTEIYPGMAEAIMDYGVDPFGDELLLLAQAVKEQSADAFGSGSEQVEAALSAAVDKAAKLDKRDRVAALIEVLEVAAEEYDAAVEDGAFVNTVEYQDSFGFVRIAEEMLAGIEMADEARAQVDSAFAELKKAWPSVTPPSAPVMEPGAVLAAVSQVGLALSSAL